jgi:S1-C subfamily serine protease
LIDDRGRIVGLVSAIFTKRSDSNIGVNFASSMALVNRVVADLLRYGKVKAGSAGIDVAPLKMDQRRKVTGVTIVKLDRNGPALSGGLQVSDIVTAVGSRRILKPADFYAALYLAKPGDQITITHVRDGKSATTLIRLTP